MKPIIFNYADVRNYLRDFYDYSKAHSRGFSYRSFARRAGLKSENYLKLVIDGQRKISTSLMASFIRGLQLKKTESEYFENLVLYTNAETLDEQQKYFDRMKMLRPSKISEALDDAKYDYFANWYSVVIRELIGEGLAEDYQAISQRLRPKISEKEARQSVELLIKLGLVARRNGQLVSTDENISTAPEMISLALFKFHREMISNALLSLESDSMEDRDMTSVTMALPKEKMEELKEMIRKFRSQIIKKLGDFQWSSRDKEVVQINFQVFDVTRRK